MRGRAFPKVYRSFEEFERDELRKLDGLHVSIDDMLDQMFGEELDFEARAERGGSGKQSDDEDEET
jgi:hypothetical protein